MTLNPVPTSVPTSFPPQLANFRGGKSSMKSTCEEGDSNPHVFRHWNLNPAPSGVFAEKTDSTPFPTVAKRSPSPTGTRVAKTGVAAVQCTELRTPAPEALSGVRIPTVVAAHPRTSGTLLAELVARAEALRSEQGAGRVGRGGKNWRAVARAERRARRRGAL